MSDSQVDSPVRRSALRLAAATLRRSGRLARRPGRALILMYHRVSTENDYLGLCVSPENFERQLRLVAQRAEFLRLQDLVRLLGSGEALSGDVAAITFDDGYRDNLEEAAPILDRLGIPATVFVTVDFVDGTRRPIGERLESAFEALWRDRTVPRSWPGIGHRRIDRRVRSLLSQPGSMALLGRLAFTLPEIDNREVDLLLSELESLARVEPEGLQSKILDWDGVRQLASTGFEIGSHTLSHAILSRVSAARVEHELAASKTRIEKELDSEVTAFAFPNGQPSDFTDHALSLLPRLGYRYACTTVRGTNRAGQDPFTLRRIGVGDHGPERLDLKVSLGI